MSDDDFDLVMATGSEKSRSDLLLEQNAALKAQLAAVTKNCESLLKRAIIAERELSNTQAALDVMREGLVAVTERGLGRGGAAVMVSTSMLRAVATDALDTADRILKGEP